MGYLVGALEYGNTLQQRVVVLALRGGNFRISDRYAMALPVPSRKKSTCQQQRHYRCDNHHETGAARGTLRPHYKSRRRRYLDHVEFNWRAAHGRQGTGVIALRRCLRQGKHSGGARFCRIFSAVPTRKLDEDMYTICVTGHDNPTCSIYQGISCVLGVLQDFPSNGIIQCRIC